jgi:cardiolipin synthase/putative cardiolipin synthase
MDGEFALDPDRGAAVLGEQLLAVRAIEATTDEEQPGPDSRLVATTPPGLDIGLPASVSRLGTRLRSSLLDAEETVRLANPYFDPDQQVIDDISRLPARGVDTRILTRQVEPGTDRHDVLERMLAGLTPSGRRNLQVRELFQLDSRTGRQAYATHAKMLIVDQELCYIGSANLTVTSLSTNFELGIVLDGPEVATATDVFDAVFDASARTTLDDGAPPGPG